VQLPIIQAPFRIYYAYNIHRLHQQLLAPADFIEPTEICEQGSGALVQCPPGTTIGRLPGNFVNAGIPEAWTPIKIQLQNLLNNPGALNYFEPKTTFRFTVSRTF